MAGLTERLAIIINADGSQAVSEFKKVGAAASSELGKAEGGAKRMGNGMVMAGAAMVGAGAAIVGAMSKMADSFIDAGKETLRLQRLTGGTAEEASRLRFVAQQTGTSVDTLANGLKFLGKNMEAGKAAFTELGVATRDGAGHFRNTEDVLYDVADAFKNMENGAQKTALAVQIFGKQGTDMIPMLNRGGDALRQLGQEAKKYGLELSGENLNSVKDYLKAHRELDAAMQGLKVQIGIGVAPVLTGLTNQVSGAVQWFSGLSNSTKQAIGTFAAFGGTSLIVLGSLTTIAGVITRMQGGVALIVKGFDAASVALYNFSGNIGRNALVAGGWAAVIAGAVVAFQQWNSEMKAADDMAKNLTERMTTKAQVGGYDTAVAQIGRINDALAENRREWEEWHKTGGISGLVDADYQAALDKQNESLGMQQYALMINTAAARALAEAKHITVQEAYKEVTASNQTTDAVEEEKKKKDELTRKLGEEEQARKRLLDVRNSEYNAIVGLGGASMDYEQAQRAVTTAAMKVQADASPENVEELNKAIRGQAEARTKVAEAQAQANGQELDGAQKAAIYSGELKTLTDRFPGLRAQLEPTIVLLDNLAQSRTAEVTVQVNGIDEAQQKIYNLQYELEIMRKEASGMTPEQAFASTELRVAGKRADGGPVSPNLPYLVGERGPEVFVPATAGSVLPNGAGISRTYNVQGLTAEQALQLMHADERNQLVGAA